MAEAVNQSLKLERSGKRDKAARNLKQVVEAASPYMAPDDVDKYNQMSQRMQQGMEESDRKSSQYGSYLTRRSRDENQK